MPWVLLGRFQKMHEELIQERKVLVLKLLGTQSRIAEIDKILEDKG